MRALEAVEDQLEAEAELVAECDVMVHSLIRDLAASIANREADAGAAAPG